MKRNIISNLSSSRVVFVALLALFVAFTGLSGCSKDAAITDPNNLGGATVTTTIVGKIVDEAGQPVAGATVTGASLTVTTNKFGIFIIKNAKVSSSRCVVIAKKAGFFTAARAESPIVNGVTNMHLGMMTNTTAFTVTASTGATLALGNGATVKFDPNSFVTSNGTQYNGTVKVSARYLDPARTDFFDYFSGDNAGRQADNTEVGLKSVGVIKVELRDASGNTLQLATGSKATLSVPKPASMATAPATMPLWFFDETIGEWKEDGSATLQAGKYVGTVTHFTDWNFDYKGETGELSARVVCNGIPIEGVVIHIFQRDITTGVDGRIHIRRVPADQTLSLEILSAKNGGNYFINVPVAVNIVPGTTLDIGDITLDSPCPAAVTGTIMDCGDSKIEGLVFVSSAKGYSHYIYTSTGSFKMNVASGVALTIIATDPNGNVSTSFDVLPLAMGEFRNVGIIQVCGTATNSFIDIHLGMSLGTNIALSPDGSLIAVSIDSSGFKVFETKTGTLVSELNNGFRQSILKLQFTTDNKKLMVLEPYIAVSILDITTRIPTVVCTVPKSGNYFSDAHIYDDGSKIIAMSSPGIGGGVLNLYSGTDGSLIKTLHPTNYVDSSANFGFDRSEDAVVFLDTKTYNTFVVWSIANDALIRTITASTTYSTAYSEEAATFGLQNSGTSSYAFYNSNPGAKISDVSGIFQSSNRYGGLVITKDNIYTDAITDSISVVKILKVADGSTVFTKLLPSTHYVSALAANRQQTHVAATTNQGYIRVWKFQ